MTAKTTTSISVQDKLTTGLRSFLSPQSGNPADLQIFIGGKQNQIGNEALFIGRIVAPNDPGFEFGVRATFIGNAYADGMNIFGVHLPRTPTPTPTGTPRPTGTPFVPPTPTPTPTPDADADPAGQTPTPTPPGPTPTPTPPGQTPTPTPTATPFVPPTPTEPFTAAREVPVVHQPEQLQLTRGSDRRAPVRRGEGARANTRGRLRFAGRSRADMEPCP